MRRIHTKLSYSITECKPTFQKYFSKSLSKQTYINTTKIFTRKMYATYFYDIFNIRYVVVIVRCMGNIFRVSHIMQLINLITAKYEKRGKY